MSWSFASQAYFHGQFVWFPHYGTTGYFKKTNFSNKRECLSWKVFPVFSWSQCQPTYENNKHTSAQKVAIRRFKNMHIHKLLTFYNEKLRFFPVDVFVTRKVFRLRHATTRLYRFGPLLPCYYSTTTVLPLCYCPGTISLQLCYCPATALLPPCYLSNISPLQPCLHSTIVLPPFLYGPDQ